MGNCLARVGVNDFGRICTQGQHLLDLGLGSTVKAESHLEQRAQKLFVVVALHRVERLDTGHFCAPESDKPFQLAQVAHKERIELVWFTGVAVDALDFREQGGTQE
ncbi:hypothetical protein ACS49_00270 [Bacillus cereus]|nr:hypothetical protein ACS49_00270 [Bacillus cereus]